MDLFGCMQLRSGRRLSNLNHHDLEEVEEVPNEIANEEINLDPRPFVPHAVRNFPKIDLPRFDEKGDPKQFLQIFTQACRA